MPRRRCAPGGTPSPAIRCGTVSIRGKGHWLVCGICDRCAVSTVTRGTSDRPGPDSVALRGPPRSLCEALADPRAHTSPTGDARHQQQAALEPFRLNEPPLVAFSAQSRGPAAVRSNPDRGPGNRIPEPGFQFDRQACFPVPIWLGTLATIWRRLAQPWIVTCQPYARSVSQICARFIPPAMTVRCVLDPTTLVRTRPKGVTFRRGAADVRAWRIGGALGRDLSAVGEDGDILGGHELISLLIDVR